jgi:competence protein ComEC
MRKIIGVAGGVIIGVAVFALRLQWYDATHQSHIAPSWFGTRREVTGIVTADPDRGLEKTKIILGAEQLMVSLPTAVDVSYGDQVSVFGLVEQPESFETDTGRQFDYPRYLSVQDIYATMKANDVRVRARHQGRWVFEQLFAIKRTFVRIVKKLFPMSEAGLFAGIMMGEKSLLPKEVLDDFQAAGLTHMIVLSGHNITLVTIGVGAIFARMGFGYRTRRLLALVVIPLFLVMTGMGASSVRAGVMAMIMLVLQITTRPAHTLRIIGCTVVVLGWINPRMVLYDPSFHLSMLAFIGLVYVVPIAAAIAQRLPRLLGFTDLIVETTAVQLFVLPYILWMSGQVSLLILVSNLLVVPFNSLIMGAGLIAVLVALFAYPLGVVIAMPVSWLLSYAISVSRVVASVHSAVFTIPPFGFAIPVLIYSITSVVLSLWHRKK